MRTGFVDREAVVTGYMDGSVTGNSIKYYVLSNSN